MRSDIAPGGVFPDYELPDHTNTMRRLSELQGDDPLILTLSRGYFCPKEHQQHLQLAAFYPQIAVAYTQIVTISTDDHHTSQEFRASVGAQWPFLFDPERTVQQTSTSRSTPRLLAVPPVLGRRSAGAGEPDTIAVLQSREGADGVGVSRALVGLSLPGDLPGASSLSVK
jgi:peroxiredoxin